MMSARSSCAVGENAESSGEPAVNLVNPAGLWLLALAIPVILVHILRPRRTPVTVSSVLLWRQMERPVSAASPWQRLQWSMLLVAQLLAVALLALAVAGPSSTHAAALAEHTVFIIDASGSMAATDGSPDRLADAKERARRALRRSPRGRPRLDRGRRFRGTRRGDRHRRSCRVRTITPSDRGHTRSRRLCRRLRPRREPRRRPGVGRVRVHLRRRGHCRGTAPAATRYAL